MYFLFQKQVTFYKDDEKEDLSYFFRLDLPHSVYSS